MYILNPFKITLLETALHIYVYSFIICMYVYLSSIVYMYSWKRTVHETCTTYVYIVILYIV